MAHHRPTSAESGGPRQPATTGFRRTPVRVRRVEEGVLTHAPPGRGEKQAYALGGRAHRGDDGRDAFGHHPARAGRSGGVRPRGRWSRFRQRQLHSHPQGGNDGTIEGRKGHSDEVRGENTPHVQQRPERIFREGRRETGQATRGGLPCGLGRPGHEGHLRPPADRARPPAARSALLGPGPRRPVEPAARQELHLARAGGQGRHRLRDRHRHTDHAQGLRRPGPSRLGLRAERQDRAGRQRPRHPCRGHRRRHHLRRRQEGRGRRRTGARRRGRGRPPRSSRVSTGSPSTRGSRPWPT